MPVAVTGQETARRACVSRVAVQSRLSRVGPGRAAPPLARWPAGAGSEGPATSTAAPLPALGVEIFQPSTVSKKIRWAVWGFIVRTLFVQRFY